MNLEAEAQLKEAKPQVPKTLNLNFPLQAKTKKPEVEALSLEDDL